MKTMSINEARTNICDEWVMVFMMCFRGLFIWCLSLEDVNLLYGMEIMNIVLQIILWLDLLFTLKLKRH